MTAVRTDRPEEPTTLDDYLFAVYDEEPPAGMAGAITPVFVRLGLTKDFFIVCCKTGGELCGILAKCGILGGYRIKQIKGSAEFLDSLPSNIGGLPLHVVKDIRDVGNGRIRWMEVKRIETPKEKK